MLRQRAAAHLFVAAAALAVFVTGACADPFFKNKTLSIVVGSTPGGAYDLISRIVARRLGSYIPGSPTVIVQDMPGAGSLTTVQYLLSTAPRDGTALGVFLPGVITQSIVTPEKVNVDLSALRWVGVTSGDYSRVCYGYGPNGIKSWAELMRRTKDHPFIMGTTGRGASNYINGESLKLVFRANIKIIFGFPGSAELRMAAARGELDGDCGGYSSIPSDWIEQGKAHPFVRFAKERIEGIPDSAVYVGDLAQNDDQRAFLNFLYGADKLGRSFVAPPDLPGARLETLRAAFAQMTKDPAFQAEMTKIGEPVAPLSGVEAQKIYDDMRDAPKSMIARAREIYE